MLTLSTIDMLLAINEGQLIEEVIITLLASPQLAVFFEKHPRLKKASMEKKLTRKSERNTGADHHRR